MGRLVLTLRCPLSDRLSTSNGSRVLPPLNIGEHALALIAPRGSRRRATARWVLVLGIVILAQIVLGAPAPGHVESRAATGDPVIAAAGDIACDPTSSSYNGGNGTSGSCHAMKTSNMLVNGGFAAVLPLGDNQYYCGGYQAFTQSYDASWGRVKTITYPAVGNHEYLTSGGTGCDPTGKGLGYFQYFGAAAGNPSQGYYSYNVGSWHLIALNSNCGSAGGCSASSSQGKWLVADLAAHPNMCTLAYWHIPLYSSGGRANGNSLYFWQALYAAHADVILSSHDHTYERFGPQDPYAHLDTANGIREFIVGTGGANHTSFTTVSANSEVRDSTTFGIMEMTLHPTGYDWNFVPEPGGTFTDSGSGSCHGSGGGGDTTPPTAPTNLAASAVSPNEVDLSWTAGTDNVGVSGYRIYRNGALVGTSATNTYADTSVQPATGYSYYATAYDAAGNASTASNTATATTPAVSDTTPPSAPTGLVATVSGPTEVDLSWTASTDNVGVTGYRLYRNGALVGTAATAAYADQSVQPATGYSYYAVAYDAAGNSSAASNTVAATTPPAPDTAPPSAPSGLVATAPGSTEVDLSWTASTDNVGVAGYRIYRNGALLGSSVTTAYADTSVQPATSYSYYVVAYDAASNTSTASATTNVTTPPSGSGVPNIFADGFESGSFSAWTASTNLVVQTSTVHSGSDAVEGNVTNAAAYTHKTLASTYGTIYIRVWFRVHSRTTNVSLLSPRTATNVSLLHLYMDLSSGKLGLRNDVTLTNRSLGSPISLDTWHSLEIKVVVSPTGGVTQVWLDGVDQTSLDSTTDNLGSTNVGDVLIGDSSSSRTYDAFWDDAAVSDTWISG
jgi:chitodextrinase